MVFTKADHGLVDNDYLWLDHGTSGSTAAYPHITGSTGFEFTSRAYKVDDATTHTFTLLGPGAAYVKGDGSTNGGALLSHKLPLAANQAGAGISIPIRDADYGRLSWTYDNNANGWHTDHSISMASGGSLYMAGSVVATNAGITKLAVGSITGATEMTGDVADLDELLINDGGAIKRVDFSVFRDAVFGDVSADATIADGGALTIADDAITGAKIALFDDSLAATTTHFLIADGTDYSSFALSGDVTCTNAGAVTIGAGAVEGSMLNDNVISGQGALGSASVAQADSLMLDDGPGTVKKVTFSNFEDSIFANISGDAAIAAGGALTIAAASVEASMINDNLISSQAATMADGNVEGNDTMLITDTGTGGLEKVTMSSIATYVSSASMAKVQFVITTAKGAHAESEALTSVANGGATSSNQDVYLNGQLLTAGTSFTDSTVVGGDYFHASLTTTYYFAFATEVGDVVTWIKRA
jgi:hypothetical protein